MSNKLHISDKVAGAIIFGIILFSFAVWKSPLFKSTPVVAVKYTVPKTNPVYKNSKTTTETLLPNSNATDTVTSTTSKATDTFTRDILLPYIVSKKQGVYNAKTFAYVIEQATKKQFAAQPIYSYPTTKIATTPTTEKARTAYRNAFVQAVKPIAAIPEYEFTTYSRALEKGDIASYTQLKKDAAIYSKVRDSFIAMSVPKDAITVHASLINSFTAFINVLHTMSTQSDDPIQTLVTTRNFFENADAIKVSYGELNIYFTLNNIKL